MECTVKISIDFDKCTGHGRCYTLSPSLFIDDERGYGQAKGDGTVASEQLEDAKRAVHSCPEHAITLEDH
jgi:ferredoxin